MPKLIALWTAPDDASGFDSDYRATHAPLVRAVPGVDAAFHTVVAGPFHRVAELRFETMGELQAGLGSEAGVKLIEDAQRLQEKFGNRLETVITAEDADSG